MDAPEKKHIIWTLVCILISMALLPCIPTSDSLWIDEAQTYIHASANTLGEWASGIVGNENSEALMPLGLFTAWVGGKTVGTTEWQLRAPNMFWLGLCVLAFAAIGRRWSEPWAPLMFIVQPFVWYYGNEARPYCLQMACGSWIAAGCVEFFFRRRLDRTASILLMVPAAVLLAATLFGVLTVGAVTALIGYALYRNKWPMDSSIARWFGVLITWGAGCGLYYVWALLHGGKGARLWHVGMQNLVFSLYEFGGFAGLGPGRDNLRDLAKGNGVVGTLHQMGGQVLLLVVLGFLLVAVFSSLVMAIRRSLGNHRARKPRTWPNLR